MNMRPRYHEWLPFATQQMRLRNLIRIEGHNIEAANKDAMIYYTLHANKESKAFYKSEALPQRHMQQKWAEFSCEEMRKSNANGICVMVWAAAGEQEQNAVESKKENNVDVELELAEAKTELSLMEQNDAEQQKEPIRLVDVLKCGIPKLRRPNVVFFGLYFAVP